MRSVLPLAAPTSLTPPPPPPQCRRRAASCVTRRPCCRIPAATRSVSLLARGRTPPPQRTANRTHSFNPQPPSFTIEASPLTASARAPTFRHHTPPPQSLPPSSPAYTHSERRVVPTPDASSHHAPDASSHHAPSRSASPAARDAPASSAPTPAMAEHARQRSPTAQLQSAAMSNGTVGCHAGTDVDGWGTWSSRRPPPLAAALPPAAPTRRHQTDSACQVQIIDAHTEGQGSGCAPALYADAAVQSEHAAIERVLIEPPPRVAPPPTADARTRALRAETDYISSSAAGGWGSMLDFVPAPHCSVMRHTVLKSEAKEPRQCSSAHYEQLLYVGVRLLPHAVRANLCVTPQAGTTSPRPMRSCWTRGKRSVTGC